MASKLAYCSSGSVFGQISSLVLGGREGQLEEILGPFIIKRTILLFSRVLSGICGNELV